MISKTVLTERDQTIRKQVALASRVLGVEDLGDFVLGHVSVRDPDGRGVWMKATGWGFEEITADRVQLLGWEGQILAGEGRRHVEYPIHTEIIRVRRDVNSVVHVTRRTPWPSPPSRFPCVPSHTRGASLSHPTFPASPRPAISF